MKLTVKNKFGSLVGSSKITDETGKEVFYAKGKFGSVSDKKWIVDAKKNKLFLVRNKMFHGLKRSCLIYDAKKKLVATIKESKLIMCGFEVEGTEEKIVLKSNNNRFPLTIYMGDKEIGKLSTVWTNVCDTYELEIKDPEDAGFLVALAIAADNIHDADSKAARKKH